MKITLLKAFPDDYRKSMALYEQKLGSSVGEILDAGDSIECFLPRGVMTKPRLARYLSQYTWYPLANVFKRSDIFHIIDHSYAHLALSLPRRKTVVTFHDAIWLKTHHGHFQDRVGKISWIKRINLKGLAEAEMILCASNASRKALLENMDYPEQRTRVIYPGCNPFTLSQTKQEARALLGLGDGPHLIHVGHNQAYKNIPGLLNILAELKKTVPDIRLIKVGTSFSPAQEALIAKLGLGARIVHLGTIESERLKLAYRAADALLLPSLDEGFGFPVLEAMSLEVPVVTSNRGSLPEVVGDAGLMSDAENYQGFAKNIERIFNDEVLRKKIISLGRVRVKQFTWQNMAAEVYSVYKQVLGKT